MLKLAQSVLIAVSFDTELFRKEYLKLITWLHPEEAQKLMNWCIQTFDMDLLASVDIV